MSNHLKSKEINSGLNSENVTLNGNETKLFLEIPTLSMMDSQLVSNLKIEDKLFYFSIKNLPVVNRIIPKGTVLISEESAHSVDEKTEIHHSEIGENIYKNGKYYYNSADGFFIYEDNAYQVLPVIKNAAFLLSVSKNAMEVRASFFPSFDESESLTIDHIIKEFKKLRITATPDERLLKTIFKKLKKTGQPIYDVVICRGRESKPGKNGSVEYLVETEKNVSPTISDDGRVDFYNLNTIHSVVANQKLAIIHPPKNGKAGVDVFGKIIPPPPVKKADNPKGANTYFREESPNVLLSKINGFISKADGKLSVSEEYNVRGNVDFHTGNIISKGAVNINGNVQSGFQLDLDKSIIINGFVNDADIKSLGTISITGGFGGSGKGTITAQGDVSLRFVRNQTIYSHADIIITKEAVDANLFAKGSILSPTGQTVIIGGTTVAGKDVEVRTLGNEVGTKTKIQVGFDYETIEKYKALAQTIKELSGKISNKEIRIRKYSNIKNLTASAKKELTEIITEYKKLQETFKNLEKERKELNAILKAPSKSTVKVTGFAYPGVEILIKNTSYKITKKIYNKTFTLSATDDKKITLK